MSKSVRTAVRLGAIAVVLALPLVAGAEADRESTGSIVSVDGGGLVLDRRGDRMSFARTPATAVQGAKRAWGDLAPDDRVTVHWDLSDQPKKAHRVDVMPARK